MPVQLTEIDASIVKGMLARGDKQQDIAAFFGTNPGRVNDVKKGRKFLDVEIAPPHVLPPPGPYSVARNDGGGDPSIAAALREILLDFEKRFTRELATTAHERRQTNEKLDMLMKQQAEIRRTLGTLERPVAPRPTRRDPQS